MRFLIDGHNLIGKTPGLRLDDPDDERKLVALLRAYLARVKKKGTVIFDRGLPGGAARWSNAVLEVRFAPLPKTADDLIAERLRREKNPRGLIVVTSDREVADAAKHAGAEVMDAQIFARQMLVPPPHASAKEKGLSADEVKAWEEIFKNRPPD